MKIVIEIPEQRYHSLQECAVAVTDEIHKAVLNGKPLPKGHGTLVEGKEVLRKIYDLRHRTTIFSNNDTMGVLDELIRFVDFMPVIVGADKEGAE